MGRAHRKPTPPDQRGGIQPAARRLRAPGEARELRALDEMRRDLRPMDDAERAARVAVRKVASLFDAERHCLALVAPGERAATLATWTGRPEDWDATLLGRFARGEAVDAPPGVALARMRRRGRAWGVMALGWEGGEPEWDLRHALSRVARGLNDVIADIERDRTVEVRARINRKIMEQLRPHDLFYQILDSLRSLARYDHSATLLIGEGGAPALEIAAEKLAWRRGKSGRVGQRFDVPAAELAELQRAGVTGWRRTGAGMARWDDAGPVPWLDVLAGTPVSSSPQEPAVGEMLVAPLSARDGLTAVLVVSAVHPGSFGDYEADLIASFLPQVSVALHNSRRTEALEARMLENERRHAMADLARGVSHDVSNALGAVVPLLQQMRADAEEGRVDPATLRQDLVQIEQSIGVCRSIFGGMLRFARSAARPGGDGSVAAAVEMCLVVLGDNLRRHRIGVRTELPDGLPRVALNQAELEQVLLNLVTNARDAMLSGGELSITAERAAGEVVIQVRDTGCGIDPGDLVHVEEPFFTTKPQGTGLGLAICRSIVWRAEGDFDIQSAPGQGTTVHLRLPACLESGSA
jgi:signal transduction histidine kinase